MQKKFELFTRVWNWSPSKVWPFFHQCFSYDFTAIKYHHGWKKPTKSTDFVLKSLLDGMKSINLKWDDYLCFHISGGRCFRTAVPDWSGGLADARASAPSCYLEERGREDPGGKETRSGAGTDRNTAAVQIQLLEEGVKKDNGKKRERMNTYHTNPLVCVEEMSRSWIMILKIKHGIVQTTYLNMQTTNRWLPVDVLPLWSSCTDFSRWPLTQIRTINSTTTRNTAPTVIHDISNGILCLLAGVPLQKGGQHTACPFYSLLICLIACWLVFTKIKDV